MATSNRAIGSVFRLVRLEVVGLELQMDYENYECVKSLNV